ncbi:hypothetical protein [Streptomyces tendae]|uniref:hypothetical protein n=1 Tax=Streptomyces tendae TaxID=1932 RepID=UPI00369688AF
MQELEETFAGPDGRRSAQLAPLAEVLEQYEQPYSLVLYLRRPGGQLIRAMASGDLECSHEALDALRQTASVHHLRALLVLAEVLEPREEQLAQFKRDIKVSLDKVTDPHDRSVLARYARWHLMPLAHHRLDRDGFNRYQRENLRRKLQTAQLLLDYIRRRSGTLDNVTQALVDRWLIANKSRQNHARSFLLWAATSHLIPETVAIASATRTIDRSIMSDADRILTALRLETDDSEHITDRVAGCLVLQYGQRTDRLVNLTTDHVLVHPEEPGVLGLQLGRDPLWLRPRLSALLQQLINERRPLAAPLRTRETPYLFPGLRPAQPMTSNTLQRRLNRLGIPSTSKARNGAWLAMVGAVHWKMLADLLGLADGTAHNWHKINGGDRASYVASRLKASQAATEPE